MNERKRKLGKEPKNKTNITEGKEEKSNKKKINMNSR